MVLSSSPNYWWGVAVFAVSSSPRRASAFSSRGELISPLVGPFRSNDGALVIPVVGHLRPRV